MADLIGQVTLLKGSEGGRKMAAYSGFSPEVNIEGGAIVFGLHFLSDDSLQPGATDAAMIEVGTPELCGKMECGQGFELFEGGKRVGRVTVLENIWKDRQKKEEGKVARLVSLTPLLGATDVARSLAFYQSVGFAITSQHESDGAIDWAHLRLNDVRVMVSRWAGIDKSEGQRAGRGTSCLYIRTDDIFTLHAAMAERGLAPTPVHDAFYGMKEFELTDPDGYRLWFAQPVAETGAEW